jgi:hypothetical protein
MGFCVCVRLCAPIRCPLYDPAKKLPRRARPGGLDVCAAGPPIRDDCADSLATARCADEDSSMAHSGWSCRGTDVYRDRSSRLRTHTHTNSDARCFETVRSAQLPKWIGCAMAAHENLARGLIGFAGAILRGLARLFGCPRPNSEYQ